MRPSARAALAAAPLLVTGIGIATATASSAATAFGYGTPTFVNSVAPAYDGSTFFQSDAAGEPSVGTDWTTSSPTTGTAMYMAATDTYKLTFDNTSTPPAVTWADRSSPYSIVSLDPILATDSATGTTLAGGDDGACAVLSRTTDDGGDQAFSASDWTPSVPCPFTADHPTVGLGPASTATPTVTGEVAYFCQQTVIDSCSHSFDGGQTWIPSGSDPRLGCLSLFGHVKIGPDGTAYVPDALCGDNGTALGNAVVGGFMTRDNGMTWSSYGIPGATTPDDGFDPSIGIDTGNRVYESWSAQQPGGDYHPVITWSDDHGATWAPPVDLAGTVPGGVGAATFEAVVAGDPGRAAVAYLAAPEPTNGKDPFATGYVGHWNLYVSYTDDGGATWQTVQATTDPVQIGEIDAGGTTTSGQRNLLDFMDASVTKDGRVLVAYADGCLNSSGDEYGSSQPVSCSSVRESQDAWASVAYQATGEGLFSTYDTAAPQPTSTVPGTPTLTAEAGSRDVQLSWTQPSDGGAAITGYDIYRGTTSGGEQLLDAVPPRTTYVDHSVQAGTTYYYEVTAVNDNGQSPPSNETSAAPSRPARPQ